MPDVPSPSRPSLWSSQAPAPGLGASESVPGLGMSQPAPAPASGVPSLWASQSAPAPSPAAGTAPPSMEAMAGQPLMGPGAVPGPAMIGENPFTNPLEAMASEPLGQSGAGVFGTSSFVSAPSGPSVWQSAGPGWALQRHRRP